MKKLITGTVIIALIIAACAALIHFWNNMYYMQILDQINQRGITVIVSTHDNNMVDYFRKRVIKLDHGEIVKDKEAGTYE